MCCKSRVSEVISVTLEVHAKVHHCSFICSFACSFVWRFRVHSQELSKIAMPVVFNEPLSFLQRMSEYMEHTHLIYKACSLSDSIDRMQVGNKGAGAMFFLVFCLKLCLWVKQLKHLIVILITSLSVDSLLLHLPFRLLHLNGKGLESHLTLCWEKHTRWWGMG